MRTLPMISPVHKQVLSLWRRAAEEAAPSAAVVAAVLSFGDVRDLIEDGTEVIRFSAERVRREDIQLLLGSECQRALDVSVIWDDREMELVHVIDLASLNHLRGETEGQSYARAKGRDFPREREL